MAWFGRSKNEDGYGTYGRTEPGYGRPGYSDQMRHPVIFGSDDMKHPIVGYTATQNSESYVAKIEQVVKYGNVPGFPAMADHKYGSPRKELYKVGDKPHAMPRISANDRPEKTSEYSPKARDEVVHRQSKNSPWNNSPPSKDQNRTSSHHDSGKHNNLYSKTNNKYREDDDDDEEDEEDEDDVICNDGVCFPNPRGGSKPSYLKDENYNENEKHKGNGYDPPTYTVPISTQPKRDAYYKTPHISTNNNNSDQKEKGNSYSPRKFPIIATQPRSKHPTNNYYELPSNNNKPTANSPPQFNAPPKRDQGSQETIDSTEARRRYGMATPGAGTGSGYDEGKYARTINSNEAAKLYNGVLLSN